LSPLVALIVVAAAVTVVLGVIGVVLAALRRRRSRTTDQAGTIFALRTAVVALVQAATQGYEVTAADGEVAERRRVGTPWAPVDAAVRPRVAAQLSLVQDDELRQLADELLHATRQLGLAAGEEGESLCRRVDSLHERFRMRSNEVVRELSLRRVPRPR